MPTRWSWLVASLLWLALMPACRQVLGLEHAEVEDDQGTAMTIGLGGTPVTGVACVATPTADCLKCRASCDLDACLGDSHCRPQFNNYAICLGKDCKGDTEQCAMKAKNGDILPCVGECDTTCGHTPLVSACELYCACMGEFCPDETLVGSAGADCLETCMGWPPEVVDCRREHCEFGHGDPIIEGQPPTMHCQHASGAEDVCPTNESAPVERTGVCLDRNESFWACNHGSECCSGKCDNGACK